ncbi:MAG: DUF1707 domain-containing protein [Kofleriaceae bacterium]|nr:DUF1707 domain-containing protein [Kofleriaceae bacterium]
MADEKPTLVRLRDEREKTISMLSDAFANDLFDVDEFEARVDKAHQANSCEALVVLRKDITPSEENTSTTTAIALRSEADENALIAAQPKTGWAVAIMGGSKRKGQWRVPKKMRAISLMGGVQLDFREAVLAPGITTLTVMACMGGVEILVPPGLAVECHGIGIMGGFEGVERSPAIPEPGQSLLRITGLALMGGVDVKTRLVGESSRQARKRRKREYKELAASAPAMLPEARVHRSDTKK